MKRLIGTSTWVTFLILVVCGSVYAQAEKTATANDDDRIEKMASDSLKNSAQISTPGTVPDESYRDRINPPKWFMQAGTFYGAHGWGFDYTMRRKNSHLYGSLFVSGMPNPDRRIPDARYFFMTGLTVEYETLLHHIGPPGTSSRGEVLRADLDGTQIYARIGPGAGVGGVGRINEELELHPIFYTSTTIGAVKKFARRRAIYIELRGRLAWIPTLADVHFIGGPGLSIGFLIFPSKPVSL